MRKCFPFRIRAPYLSTKTTASFSVIIIILFIYVFINTHSRYYTYNGSPTIEISAAQEKEFDRQDRDTRPMTSSNAYTGDNPNESLAREGEKKSKDGGKKVNNGGDGDGDVKHDLKTMMDKWIHSNSVYHERLTTASNHCFKRAPGEVRRIIVDKPAKRSAFCVIPRVGCTHWINVFRTINRQTEGVVYRTPDDIPRWTTHYGKDLEEFVLAPRSFQERGARKKISFLGDSFRFMFVRDPYRRLWSAWVDKFLLPDFWFTEGGYVAEFLKLKLRDILCPSNITFQHFLRHVTDGYFTLNPEDLNPHWAPYYTLCDPCLYRPHLIGKMETFAEDAEVAMSVMNFDPEKYERRYQQMQNQLKTENRTLPTQKWQTDMSKERSKWREIHQKDRAVHEMIMLSAYTFDGNLASKKVQIFLKGCRIQEIFVAQRLWKAFKINGYIRSDLNLTLTQWSREDWEDSLRQAYDEWDEESHVRRKQQKDQRDRAFVAAYRETPLMVLRKLQLLYRHDFEQFGYDQEPKEIFDNHG